MIMAFISFKITLNGRDKPRGKSSVRLVMNTSFDQTGHQNLLHIGSHAADPVLSSLSCSFFFVLQGMSAGCKKAGHIGDMTGSLLVCLIWPD
jgi:hypothetical protein